MILDTYAHTTTPLREAVERLRERVGGAVMLPGDAGYDESRKVWNAMIDKRPAVIIQPSDVAGVIQAVQFARQQGLTLSIKGGGHNVAGHAVAEGGLMIDMCHMRSVQVDPVRRTARVEGGATWGDFDRETAAFGLATTGGVISSTGVAGLTLGGGIGWLVGKHGLAIDNLLGVDIVTADGELLRANKNEHPDLFWAVRGGGGNFGVVTSFEFQLHPIGDVLAGYLAWPAADVREVFEFYREFTENNPEEMTTYFQVSPNQELGMQVAVIAVFYPGDIDEGQKLVDQIRAFKTPLAEMVQPMPYQQWQQAFDEEFPDSLRYYWKGVLMSKIHDGVIDAVVEHAVEPPLPFMGVAIEHYRGAMNRVDPSAAAFPNRDARYQMVIIAASDDAVHDDTGRAWARSLNDRAQPYSTRAAFLNFNSAEDATEKKALVRAGFRDNYNRLVNIKRRYDPTNLFSENNNISPDGEE